MILFLNNFIKFLVLLIPPGLVSGPAIPDIIISLSGIIFLIIVFYKKEYSYFNNKIIIFFLFWCLYLIFLSSNTGSYYYMSTELDAIHSVIPKKQCHSSCNIWKSVRSEGMNDFYEDLILVP